MRSLVVDASALIEYLLRTPVGVRLGPILEDGDAYLNVPALCDVEVVAALRRGLLMRRLDGRRAAEALEDYLDLPTVRHGHEALLARALVLRDNVTAYDAMHVALAERLGATLVTADSGLQRTVSSMGLVDVVSC